MTEYDARLDERILRRIPREILLVSLAGALIAWPLADAVSALLVLAGGGLAAAGFIRLKKDVQRFLGQETKSAVSRALLLYGARLLLILGVFLVIILLFARKVIAFAAGFSSVILVFLVEAAAALSKLRQWKN
jgi:hypothetical protein